MAKQKWMTFQEAVAEVHGERPAGFDALETTLRIGGPKNCPAPTWNPDGTYRVALVGSSPQIQVLNTSNTWEAADLQPPATSSLGSTEVMTDEIVTRTKNILFMDVTGWSRLSADQIHTYVTRAMPRIAKELVEYDFLNTWGDAIVATFPSAKSAAESALKMRDFYVRALPLDGIPQGLSCRIALHQGEVILCANALLGRKDIFGEAVHVAARLEPVTAVGQVFCTPAFAGALAAVSNLGPKATSVGSRQLAKAFGETEVFVVTWHNEQPQELAMARAEPAVGASASSNLLAGDDAETRLLGWLNKLPVARSGESFIFEALDAELGLEPGSAASLLNDVVAKRGGGWSVESKSGRVIVLRCRPAIGAAIVRSKPRSIL